MPCDKVHIKNLRLQTVTGPDLWNKLNLQKCLVSMNIGTDFAKASATDDLKYSLNYAVICRDTTQFVQGKKNWNSLPSLARAIYDYTNDGKYQGATNLEISVKNQDLHLRTSDILCKIIDSKFTSLEISNLELFTIIGVFTFERLQKQKISLDLNIKVPATIDQNVPIKKIIDKTVDYLESSNFKTVEALVECVGKVISQEILISNENNDVDISVKVTKLSAITDTDGVGVSSQRDINYLKKIGDISISNRSSAAFNLPVPTSSIDPKSWSTSYLAFGSNMGDRLEYITLALKLLQENEKVRVSNISSLFESEPMYFKDQNAFMNGCIEIKTRLNPQELLRLCKEIEYDELKRVKHFDNGPRCIDLDIILYINSNGEPAMVNDSNLIVPHQRMIERTFVLEPLCELIPPTLTHPITAEPIIDHLIQLYNNKNEEDDLWKLIPLPKLKASDKSRFLRFKTGGSFDPIARLTRRKTVSPTYIMGILNTTPDSFSDGGEYFNDIKKQMTQVEDMCQNALKLHDSIIIDIGGCSTRPNSKQATVKEELERTIPIIKAIRESAVIPQEKIILSIDTYRSEVAERAIEAGVDIINDISGSQFDNKILDVVAANPHVAYVLSHIRGDINSMSSLTSYASTRDIVGTEYIFNDESTEPETEFIRVIGHEMTLLYEQALQKGVKRWQIILDPGLGFAKKEDQNLLLIKNIPLLKNYSYANGKTYINFKNLPILVGPSRKKFIGSVTKDAVATDRDFATGSVVTSCVGYGSDIVRVHDVANCAKSVKLADLLYKTL